MSQSRRVSPRIPYEEAICLARIDGEGRLYGRGLNLGASGIWLVSEEACPIGTEITCNLLLPHGPRSVNGKIVRVTAAPGGFQLAVAFGEIKPAVAAMIAKMIADRIDDGPRPAPDAAPGDVQHARTKRYGTPRAENLDKAPAAPRLPPINLPPPCGHPLPSVVVAGLSRDEQALEAPRPKRRVPSTAAIARRPDLAAWAAMRPGAAMATVYPLASTTATERLTTLQMAVWWSRARWVALPIALALVIAIVHFSH